MRLNWMYGALLATAMVAPSSAQISVYIGTPPPLQPGMIISLHRGSKKKEFRVQWIKQLSPNELQAGVECLQPQGNFWGVDLSDEGSEAEKESQQALMTRTAVRARGGVFCAYRGTRNFFG